MDGSSSSQHVLLPFLQRAISGELEPHSCAPSVLPMRGYQPREASAMLPQSSQGIFVLQQLLSVIRTSCCLLWKQLFVSILGHAFAWTVTPFHPRDDDVRSVRSPFQQPRWHSLGRKVCGRNAHCCTLAFILVASQRTCNFHHHRLGTLCAR